MKPLDQLLVSFPLPSWRPLAWTVIALICAAVGWAWVTELDRIAIARGVVIPQGKVRVVQHLEGGVVKELFVRNGDRVRAGQMLMRLDLGAGGASAAEILAELDALRLERSRLTAETSQIDLHLPEDEAARQPDIARAERLSYRSRKREHESALAVMRDQRSQKELEVQSINSRLSGARDRLAPLQEQFEITEYLVSEKLQAKSSALTLERELKSLQDDIANFEIELPRAQTALAEALERELFERNRFRSEAAERLRQVEFEIARKAEALARAAARADRRLIESPIDGVITNLNVNTLGGVVAAGDPIAEIVPIDEKLVIEARLSPMDVGHVSIGHPARVKIATYDYLRYGVLIGQVARIAADASRDEQGEDYFEIIIETTHDYLETDGEHFPISPGMTAEVDITLGKRSVGRYLIEPVLKLRNEAFQGR